MERIKPFFKNLMGYLGQMTASQAMLLLGVVAGSVVGIVLVVGWLNSVTYSRLYSDLSENEAGEVVAYLNEQRIPYQLSQGGRTVEVPSESVYKTRISLATEGLPQSGNVGYSIFDQNNLGMTDFLQKLNFRRALEGELTRTIMQLDEVQAARVHIAMPKERLFKEDRKEATASVVLKLKGSGTLSRRQVNGITHLMASSVEGLTPDHIAVIDYNGNLLSSGQERDPVAGLSASQLDVRKQVETYLQDKAQSMMDDVLGTGKSVIRLTADLNFQQIERTPENFDPNTPSIRSEERISSNSTLMDRPDEAAESNEENKSETVITNYELNKSVEHIINALGTIDRLSVAVMVDGIYAAVENENGVTEMIYQPRPQEDLDRLAAIVRNAVGFDSQRNDQIEMVNIAFDRQSLDTDQQVLDSMYAREFYMDIAKKVLYVLLILGLLLYARKKSSKLFAALGKLVPPPMPRTVVVNAPSEQEVRQEPIEPALPEKRQPKLVDKMQETAKKEPEEIAKVIKTMMIE